MKYSYVSSGNEYMLLAYRIAKAFYRFKKWNLKTTPVCVFVKDSKIASIGISGDGMHPMLGECARLNSPGSPYSDCRWCSEEMHAEQDAIKQAKIDLYGAVCYLYGHYRVCASCEASMAKIGIKEVVLLENSDTLFDRHKQGTVIGTKQQFLM